MTLLLALAAIAATPLPVPADLQADIACVVTIARAAPTDPTLQAPGREYAAVVGAEIIDTTGRTREQARDLFAQALHAPPSAAAALPTCKQRMIARLLSAKLPEPIK